MEGPIPAEADFTKTLSVVLLAEYTVVTGVRAVSLYLSGASLPFADTASICALWLFVATLGMNLCSMAGAVGMRKDASYTAFAKTSLSMTAGQLALLCASYLAGGFRFNLVAATFTAVTLIIMLLWGPGKFLSLSPR